MSLYAISDLHLAMDSRLDKPMGVFGPVWENHFISLEQNWKSTIKETDTVVIPGDISWGINLDEADADLRFIDSLPGKKILLRGNHDLWWSSMKKMRGRYESVSFIQNDAVCCENFVLCGSRGWLLPWRSAEGYSAEENAKIFKRELIRMEMALNEAHKLRSGKVLIACSHFPPLDKDHQGTLVTELYQKYKVDIALYGHLHGKHFLEAFEGKSGGIEYKLVSFDRLNAVPYFVM